jgi:quercetin dioxygenase-like cupin family protein
MTEQGGGRALRPAAGQMLTLRLADEIARLKAKPEWSSASRLSESLVKDAALNILLMVLKRGARLAEHRTKGPIALQVVSGAVRFAAGGRSATLEAGALAALDREVVHELEALEESVVILTTAIG